MAPIWLLYRDQDKNCEGKFLTLAFHNFWPDHNTKIRSKLSIIVLEKKKLKTTSALKFANQAKKCHFPTLCWNFFRRFWNLGIRRDIYSGNYQRYLIMKYCSYWFLTFIYLQKFDYMFTIKTSKLSIILLLHSSCIISSLACLGEVCWVFSSCWFFCSQFSCSRV